MTKIKQPKLSAEMPQKMPPEVSFDETELPEIKDWKVGGKYGVDLEIEMISIGKDTMDKENELRARFKVLAVKAMDHMPEHKGEMFPKGYKGNPNRL